MFTARWPPSASMPRPGGDKPLMDRSSSPNDVDFSLSRFPIFGWHSSALFPHAPSQASRDVLAKTASHCNSFLVNWTGYGFVCKACPAVQAMYKYEK